MAGSGAGTLKKKVMVWLLVLMPAALAIKMWMPDYPTVLFLVACAAIIPLASFMGSSTEVIAHRLGPALGGLMNASFGNAAELILAFTALRAGQVEMVKASLTGSIIGNILLVFGAAILTGCISREKQSFNATGARADTTMLVLAATGLIIPAVFHKVVPPEIGDAQVGHLSVGVAVVLLIAYGLGLLFTLKTHAHLYNETEDEEFEAEGPTHSVTPAVVVLLLATVGVAVVSELIVHAVEGAVATLGFTHTFVGVVLIATVGNAAEHSTAILVALKGKMSLALSICVESSKQIALFVAPLLVLVSLGLTHQMNLEFTSFEVVAVVLSVWVVHMVAQDGEVNWLEGVMLLALYCMLGIALFYVP